MISIFSMHMICIFFHGPFNPDPTVFFKRGSFLFSFCVRYSKTPQISRWMSVNDVIELRTLWLWHWQPDALTTRLDLIHIRVDLIHTRLDLNHIRLDLIHTRLDLIHIRLDLIHTLLCTSGGRPPRWDTQPQEETLWHKGGMGDGGEGVALIYQFSLD
jgi:hypothetical protein